MRDDKMSGYYIKATEFPMTVIYGHTPDGERLVRNLKRGEVFEFDGWLHHAEQTPNTEGPSDNAMAGSGYVSAPVNPSFLAMLQEIANPPVTVPTTEIIGQFSPVDPLKEPEPKVVAPVVEETPTPQIEEVKPTPKKRGPKPKPKAEAAETPAE